MEAGCQYDEQSRSWTGGLHTRKRQRPRSRGGLFELDRRTLSMLREWRRTQLEERLRASDGWKRGEWVVADELGAYLRPVRLGKRERMVTLGCACEA